MKNAHERLGTLEFVKTSKDTRIRIRVHLERFIGEKDKYGTAHLLAVFGGDSDVGSIWAAVLEGLGFTVTGPGIESRFVSLGANPQCFRGSLTLPGRKRPVRHLVAISEELARTRPGTDPNARRTILCQNDPAFVLCRVAQRFGLPVIPEWSQWFHTELHRRQAVQPLLGLGCSPVAVTGGKGKFLGWIAMGLRNKEIEFPKQNGPVMWKLARNFLLESMDRERQESREPSDFHRYLPETLRP